MNPQVYAARWQKLKEGPPDPAAVEHLSRQIALSFMDACLYCDRYESACIDLLCRMATAHEADGGLTAGASSALFNIVVEGLCDEFEDMQTEIYDRVMCQIISFCRHVPQGRELDRRLSEFGFISDASLLGRATGLRRHFLPREEIPAPARILFLSRVTFGADIAITSVLMQRFADAFPGAEPVLIGGAKLQGIFGGFPNLRIRELQYPRRGDLIQRFSSWFSTLEAIEAESAEVDGRFLVVDPDSRLTQLGILPVAEAGRYLFFNSRFNGNSFDRPSMSASANAWANRMLPDSAFCQPGIWIDRASQEAAGMMLSRLRQSADRLITVNLGVGGNRRKRLDDDFEFRLLASLLSEKKTSVILDCGAEAEEKERADNLLAALKDQGFDTARATDVKEPPPLAGPGLVSIVSSIGEVAALIAGSDEFIGYDSACQHIAAAAGVPSCTVFAGSNNPRFVRRWQAQGKSVGKIVHVDNLSSDRLFDNADIIARISDARKKA